jgi:hypothetical protein
VATAEPTDAPLPGRDGLPVVRDVATWISAHPGAVLTDSPALANVVEYYAGVPAALVGDQRHDTTVNPAYRHRDPTSARYFVWDTWTATSDPQRSRALLEAARLADAHVALTLTAPAGPRSSTTPVTVVVLEATP